MIEVHPAVPLSLPGQLSGQSGGKSTRDKTGGLNPGVLCSMGLLLLLYLLWLTRDIPRGP